VSLNKGKFARLNGVVREKDKDDLGICPLLGKKKKINALQMDIMIKLNRKL